MSYLVIKVFFELNGSYAHYLVLDIAAEITLYLPNISSL